ncbi:hypothetical protein B0J14DRAFT_529390 [Halenospora varia]|nr:hypothetical protein B0J14DRAFT_529390 [Halenospora varia]
MAYDGYGRPRNNGEPGYFENKDGTSDYSSYASEPRDNNPSGRTRESYHTRQRTPPFDHDRMTTTTDRGEPPGREGVSPEVIAAITEQVERQVTEKLKKELVEHWKQTGNFDDPAKSHPMQRQTSKESSSTSSPPPTARKVYTPPSPTQSSTSRPTYPPPPSMETRRSPPASPLDKPSGVRFSDREPRARPSGPGRSYSTVELSTIDQKWGRLFDSEGNSTKRLGEFLRGLANHMVECFEPTKSIVVTPVKMVTYYSQYPISKEPHPLLSMFKARSNEQISRLYQDLGCQHHLVQEDLKSEPVVPALTPLGFAQWMTLFILAYPEEESERLSKVILAMPIDADGCMVDNKPERLPKQISRHLLPEREDKKSRKLLENAVGDFFEHLGTTNRRKASITSPPLSRQTSTSRTRSHPVEIHQNTRTSPTSSKAPPIERKRNPYSGAPSKESNPTTSEETIKIERERQPYTAQPGSGKVHESSKMGRTNSTRSRSREYPEPGRHRAQSSASSNFPPPPQPSQTRRRPSSPPLKSWSNSTPTHIDSSKYETSSKHESSSNKYGPPPSSSSSSFPSSQPFSPSSYGSEGSTSFPPPPPPIDIRDNRANRRSRDDRDYPNRGAEEDARIRTGEFNSPRDAERWDRYQESHISDSVPYERGSVSIDPIDMRGAPTEDWYRDKPRNTGYYGTRGGY